MNDFHFVVCLAAFISSTSVAAGYCFGRAHQLKESEKASDYWYNAYQDVLKRLHEVAAPPPKK